jgi:MarR family transcriptional regulator, transcriptional regulator for hemolysin
MSECMNPLRSFGFLLRDVSRLYVRRFEQRAAALGLTLLQCRALVYLALHEGLSQARLAELTDVEPMTLVRILDRMESDGWLERRVDMADRRARYVYLKAKAKPLVADIWKLADLTRDEAFLGVPKKQASVLIALLDQIRNNLAALEPLPPATSMALPPNARGRRRTGATRPRRQRSTAQP